MDDQKTQLLGKQAAYLTLVETGLGSLLHGLKIPLAGQLLSLNQIAFMARLSHQLQSKDAALKISVVASVLKSLSPAGKKLTPMLAILTQGLLFSSGLTILGMNLFGFVLASLLSAVWAFVQPIALIYLLFGQTSIDVAKHFIHELQKISSFDITLLWPLVMVFIALKLLAGIVVCFVALSMSEENYNSFQQKMLNEVRLRPQDPNKSAFMMAIKDLCSPLFIISFIITALFFYFSHASESQMIWGLLRPLAVGFIVFYLVRIYPAEKIALLFERFGFLQMAGHLKEAIAFIRGQRKG